MNLPPAAIAAAFAGALLLGRSHFFLPLDRPFSSLRW